MELGVLGLDGFQSLDGETSKHKWGSAARSGGFRLEGSGFFPDDLRSSKIPRTDGDYSSSSSSTQQLLESARNLPLRPLSSGASDANMLSFSSCDKSESSALPYFQQVPSAKTTTGYYSGGLSNSAGMYLLNGVRGPFTPSQWLELEQQALIYKYMTANEPIPAQLLIPIKKAFESAGLFGFTGATLRPTPWGWGPFHLGYSNSNDPEPGRCRRTDGKKWRCSRDAMPDQKYCERHMNRGRHRSRKHVEGQAKSTPATTTTTTATTTSYTPTPSAMAPEARLSNNFDMTHHYHQQAKNSQHSTSINPLLNSCQGLQDSSQHSFLSLSGESMYPIPKHRNSNQEFTITTSQKNSGFCCGNDNSTQGLNTTDGSSLLWPGLQSPLDTTQLSMSHQQLEMGLGVGEQTHTTSRQTSWIPSTWEPSMGGPLGEALQSGNGDGKRTSSSVALNLLPKGWDAMGNYQVSSSSPTGVLQKSALVSSMSNSSAGSSPRGADNSKNTEGGGSLCNDLH